MKKALIVLLLMVIALSGCSSPFISKENARQDVSSGSKQDSRFNYPKPLTLEKVKTAIKAEGVQFSENQRENPNDYAINNVTPMIYTLKQNNNILMIYIYESIALRIEACTRGEDIYDSNQLPQKENWLTTAYTAKNVLIINMCNTENYQSNTTAFVWKALREAADSLNDVKELVFTDKGSYCDASIVVKYFQYWYKDKDDTIHLDQYATEQWLVKYLGSDPESVHVIKYEYKSQLCDGSGTVHMPKIDKEYYLRIGNSSSSNIPDKDYVYTLTIQWGGKTETLHLKMIKTYNMYLLPIVSMHFLKQQGFI